MFYDRKILIYKLDEDTDKVIFVSSFDTMDEMFHHVDMNFETFGSDWEGRHSNDPELFDNKNNRWETPNIHLYYYICFDEYDNHYSRDRLVGFRRQWYRERRRRRRIHGFWTHQAYGSWRHIRTTHERRWANAWNDEEFAPKTRAKRNAVNLPSVWVDFLSHADKCWKTQSKRKRQWKCKT